jgi:hypothetical protein
VSSGLFANQRETNLVSTIALVEAVLADLGNASKIEDRSVLHAWQISKGSSTSHVTLIHRSEFTHIRVCATVMTLDDKVDRQALHAHLLDLNTGLCGAAFATAGDRVLLLTERSTLDIDRSEVLELIRRVLTYADDLDNVLVARFGGAMGSAT